MGMLSNGKTKKEWKNGGKLEARRIFAEIGRLTGLLGFCGPSLLNSHCNTLIPRSVVHRLFTIKVAIRRLPAAYVPELQ
ncbi:hypothetical protein HAX54_040566, partial [Datura stramonium]|nr:hypothetical protein [Datura stramonium]